MNYLKELRELRGLTQVEVAEALGVTRNYIWYLETDKRKPSIGTAKGYSDLFGVSVDKIIEEIGVE